MLVQLLARRHQTPQLTQHINQPQQQQLLRRTASKRGAYSATAAEHAQQYYSTCCTAPGLLVCKLSYSGTLVQVLDSEQSHANLRACCAQAAACHYSKEVPEHRRLHWAGKNTHHSTCSQSIWTDRNALLTASPKMLLSMQHSQAQVRFHSVNLAVSGLLQPANELLAAL
jgi:hypothetical protein